MIENPLWALILGAIAVAIVLPKTVQSQSCPANIPEWTGDAANKKWTSADNWTFSDPPGTGTGADACLRDPADDTGFTTCEYDQSELVGEVTVFGVSPTLFTLHVVDEQFKPLKLDLLGSCIMDVDKCVEVTADFSSTELEGQVAIDVANGINCCLDDIDIKRSSAVLDLVGTATSDFFEIDCVTAASDLEFKLKGGGTLIANDVYITSSPSSGSSPYVAGITLENGTFDIRTLNLLPGASVDKRIAIDLDRDLTVRNSTTIDNENTGYGQRVVVDVAAGVTFDTGVLTLAKGTVLKVTGTGTPKGQLVSSPSEGASDAACSCSP